MKDRNQHPDPFNHGTTTIAYYKLTDKKRGVIKKILKRGWGISRPTSVLGFGQATKVCSSNYKIITPESELVLRESKINDVKKQAIVNQCMIFAKNNNLPVPEIVATKSGQSFFCYKNQLFTLTKYINGEYFNGSRLELKRAAKLLAKFHAKFLHFPKTNLVAKVKKDVYPLDMTVLKKIKQIIVNKKKTKFDRYSLDIIETINQIVKKGLADFSSLPRQVGHFDINPHNLLFNAWSKKIVAIVDFDLVRVSQRTRDVAIAMHRLARTFGSKTERKQDMSGNMVNRAKLFINTYKHSNHLTKKEVWAIPGLIIDEAIRKTVYILAKHYLKNDVSSDFDLKKQVAILGEADQFRDIC